MKKKSITVGSLTGTIHSDKGGFKTVFTKSVSSNGQ